MQYSDYELVYMVRENEEALSLMVKKYEPLFRRLAYSFVLKNPNKGLDVEDLIQQCRITMCYALARFNSNNDVMFYSFLLICLKRAINNYARVYLKKPDVYYYMDIDNYDNLDEFIDLNSSDDLYNNIEFENKIKEFKYDLNFLDGCIFELRYNGFLYKEIASLLEINYKKVDNSLLSTRKKMEKSFLF